MTLLTDRAARAGLLIFIALWGALLLIESARASEVPPPLIGDVRRMVGTVRRTLAGEGREGPRTAQPGDGPMCVPALVEDAADDIPERETVERVLAKCSRVSRRSDPWAVLTLTRLERDMGAPAGLLTSAACIESGLRTDKLVRGDWLHGVARAHGVLQLHGVFLAACRLTEGARDSVDAAGRCYLSRVLGRLPEALACPWPWTVAEARVANAPRYLPLGCEAASEHAAELARWAL